MKYSTLSTDDLVARLPTALNARDRRLVNALILPLIERRAPLGRQWRSLAIVMSQNGEHRSALAAIRLYAESQGQAPQARLEEVFTLHRAGRITEARAVLAKLPPDIPDRATRAYLLGTLDSMAGALDRAREELRDSIRLAPDVGQTWLALAMIDRLPAGSAAGEAIIGRDPRRTGKSMKHPDAFFYALGKVYADRADHAAAFDAFSEGARLATTMQPYDPTAEATRVEQVRQGFDRAFIDRVAASVTIDTSRPIIVTGNPRSGTTLVEHILSSHSAVDDGGELDIMRIVGQEIGGPTQTDLERYLAHHDADELGRLYLHLLDQRFGGAGRIVDKRLFASRTLGIIASVLPEAPIIWMRRDPLDCAWSCFRTYFNQSSPWSHSLETIAQHFKVEDAMLVTWQERLGSRLLVIPYEDLVDAPEFWTRRLLDHCGLLEEAAVFTPHKSHRAVMTASVMQVRRPINRDGIGTAEPYRTYMKPFIDAYYG